ncbi:ABC transporter permease [Agrococcus sp. Ld7]|uniref:ABC transporter permease n=1 Tax=Agrococcus sp. Ld7 TaxID=649148 RepID=UPI00386E21EB
MTDIVAAIQDAWTELRIHRGRVLMSLIGVTVAIAALTASVAVGELARSTLLVSFESQSGRPATVSVNVGSSAESGPTAADHRAALDVMDAAVERYAIDYASARSTAELPLGGGAGGVRVSVEAAEPDFAVMRHLATAHGRFLNDSDRVRLAPAVVVNRGVLDAIGGPTTQRTVELGGVTAVIVGVVDRGGGDDWPQAWMLPRDLVRVAEALGPSAYLNSFQLEAWVPEEIAADGERMLAQDLRSALPGASVDAYRSDWQAFEGFDPLLPLQLTLIGTASVILLLGALGLITVAVVSIRQRVREFGIRRAFGASRSRIFVAVMLESVVGTVVAGTIGIALCIFAYRLPIVQETLTQGLAGVALPGFPMGAAVTGLLVSALVGAIAGSIPATIAVRSKVIEAIRF